MTTITPPTGISMQGDFTGRLARSVSVDLTSRALVLDDGAVRIAIVVVDLIIVNREIVAQVRRLVTEHCGIDADHIMISATHTHTGPALFEVGNDKPDTDYMRSLPARMAESILIATESLIPAQIAVGASNAAGLFHNRRIRLDDGSITMNFLLRSAGKSFDDLGVVGPSGPADPQVIAMIVEDLEFNPIALWANVQSHHGDTDDEFAYSPDYFGQFSRRVSTLFGPGCVGLLSTGALGNINTIDLANTIDLPYGDRRGGLVADAILGASLQAVRMKPRSSSPRLNAVRWKAAVKKRWIDPSDLDLARQIVADEQAGRAIPIGSFNFAIGDPVPESWKVLFARELLQVDAMSAKDQAELQLLRIGDLALAGLPGEFFIEYGLDLKRRSQLPLLAPIGLANDYIGYIPTREAIAEGGYETWIARSSWASPEVGPEVVESLIAHLGKLVN